MTRILVIDDNDDACAVIKHVLESAGYEVLQASDGARGIALQRKSPAALVITDILMPEKDGIETIRDLRQEFPDLAIIAMSGGGWKSADPLAIAQELGAHAVLRKPFAGSTLLKSVQEALKLQ